jgi:hypothetical protein
VADVDRVDARRAALEQAVREPAGRGADVEAHAARGVDGERVERGRQLDAAARDVGMRRSGDLDLGVLRHGDARLVGAPAGDGDRAREDHRLRLLAGRSEAAQDEQAVEAQLHDHPVG